MTKRTLLALLALALPLGGCGEAPESAPERLGGSPQADGASLFAVHCTICHGADGAGTAMVAPDTDFTAAAWQEARSDAQIAAAIRAGVPGTAMPPFPRLKPEEVEALVRHVRGLAAR